MNLAFSIVLLFTLLDCVTNESSLALKGCHVPLTAFYRAVKALVILDASFLLKIWPKLVPGHTLPESSMPNRHT